MIRSHVGQQFNSEQFNSEPINTVPKEGLEPSHPKAQEPKSCVSTSSTTPAPPSCQNLNTTYGAQILTSRRRSLQMQVALQLVDVTGGLDVVLGDGDGAFALL